MCEPGSSHFSLDKPTIFTGLGDLEMLFDRVAFQTDFVWVIDIHFALRIVTAQLLQAM